jgi:hypothetical protein
MILSNVELTLAENIVYQYYVNERGYELSVERPSHVRERSKIFIR